MRQGINNIDNTLASEAIHTLNKEKLSNSLDSSLSFIENDNLHEIFSPSKGDEKAKSNDLFEDYLNAIEERNKEKAIKEQTKDDEDREAAKKIRNNLSADELKLLSMMGIDVDTARLSDVMDMVNNIRGNEHREATKEMFAKIKAKDMDIESCILGKNELAYLVKNNMVITRENLYKAHYSGIKEGERPISDEVFASMQQQLEGIISGSGFESFTMEDARFLLDNELPVNQETIKTYVSYKKFDGQDISEIDVPEDETEYLARAGRNLYEQVQEIRSITVRSMVLEGKSISIQSAYSYQKSIAISVNDAEFVAKVDEAIANSSDEVKQKAITATRRLEEIRLSMTLKASVRIMKMDVNIDTKELSKVVDNLRRIEENTLLQAFKSENVEVTEDSMKMLSETTTAVNRMKLYDASVLGRVEGYGAFTIRNISAAGESVATSGEGINETLSRRMVAVEKSYEAVGTAPRKDLGDNIEKAFSNVEELLKEIKVPVDEESIRAVKILGRNQLQITPENVQSIMNYDRQVNQLMDSFSPEAVMGLIKDGINPMDIPIAELNNIITDKNYNKGVTEASDFATYLLDMERRGKVSNEERESYIGIFRVMNRLAKSGDAEAGYIFANKANLTIRNMIRAMRSRSARGLDIGIDDSVGMVTDIESNGKRYDEQIERSFKQKLDDYRSLNPNVEEFIRMNSIEYNMSNAFAVNAILNEKQGIYSMISEVMSKLSFKAENKEEAVDEATEDMTKSMIGTDEITDLELALSPENILRELNEKGDLRLTYEDIKEKVTAKMFDAAIAGVIGSMDLSIIKNFNAGLTILGEMSRTSRYQLPVETNQGLAVVNLTIDRKLRGQDFSKINVEITDGSYGRLTLELSARITKSGRSNIVGSVVADASEDNERLMADEELKGKISSAVAEHLPEGDMDISLGQKKITNERLDENNLKVGNSGLSREICLKLGVSLVKVLADI